MKKSIKQIINKFKNAGKGNYRQLLKLAYPLIITTGTWSLQNFIDRMFLSWHSTEAIAAANPAGNVNFTIISLFMGISNYSGTFVAHYFGAKQYKNIGKTTCHAIYIALIGGLLQLLLIPAAPSIFKAINHAAIIQNYEIIYLQYLAAGSFFVLSSSVLSSFFSGIGRPLPVMWVNIIILLINIILDYCFIFGNFGFPALGLKGAAIATNIAYVVNLLLYLGLIAFSPKNKIYFSKKGFKFDFSFFRRLWKFGFPNGIQFFIDTAGLTVFILLLGQLGLDELAASNIAFIINSITFMPILGMGFAVSIIVGQSIGEGNPQKSKNVTYAGLKISAIYTFILIILLLVTPQLFLAPFAAKADPLTFKNVFTISKNLLIFIAVYSLFQTFNINFSSLLKGAGDTRFIMLTIIFNSILILILPTYIGLKIFHCSIYFAWSIIVIYAFICSLAYFIRFKTNKWQSFNIIDSKNTRKSRIL